VLERMDGVYVKYSSLHGFNNLKILVSGV